MIPFILDAPFIIAALIGIFQAAITFFLQFMTRKFAAIAAATVLFVSLTAAMIVALNVIIAGISYATPNEITMAMSWFMPSNITACVSAYYSAVAVKFVYDLKAKVVRGMYY
jgi:Family of unknown function (DUF5455)